MRFPFCEPIDKLLNGGLEIGCITNFYGQPGSAKSQIALQTTVKVAYAGRKVIFVDTEGGFSVERIGQMCNGFSQNVLDNIVILEPKEWTDQRDAIRGLEELCRTHNPGLVVVDSIIALWRLTIAEENAFEINREMATQLSILSRIAREHKIPVLITNQVYADVETGKIEMSCKNIMKSWSKNVVELEHTGEAGRRRARIVKSRSIEEGRETEFVITSDSLKAAEAI